MNPSSILRTYLISIKTVVLVLVMLSMTAQGLKGAETGPEWPRWRGPDLNGISSETGWLEEWPAEGPRVLWRASVGTGFSSLAVSQGRLYTMGNTAAAADEENQQDQVFCLDATTGEEIWKHAYPCKLTPRYYKGGPSATPTVEGDRVYTFSKEGHLFCLDSETGKEIWSRHVQEKDGLTPPKWGFAGSVLVAGDLIVLNAGGGGLALKKDTGDVVWKNGDGVAGYSTPLPFKAGGHSGLAMYNAKELVAVDTATGKMLWRHPWKTNYDVNASDPIFAGDRVFISTGYGAGCTLLKVGEKGLKEIWRNKNMSNQCNSSVLFEGHLYGFSGNVGGKGILTCLDLESGEVKWTKKRLGTGSLMLADKKLIVLSEKGMLVIAHVNPEEYDEIQRAEILDGLCWTVPVLCNGKIYARCAEGDLVCVDPGTRDETAGQ
jgi:outer membrane protein assembly factor BamB